MLAVLLAEIAAQQCAHVAVPEASELAIRFYKSGNILWIFQQLWNLGLPLLFLFTGLTGKLGAFSERWGKKWYPSLVIYLLCFIALYQLISLPLDYYSSFIREHAYGLSTQSVGRWFGNWGKSILVTAVGSIAFIWIFYLLLKKSPQRWWFYSGLVSTGVFFFMLFIQPLWIDPLFNTFEPMKNKQLEQQVLRLAERSRIEGARVFEMNMSQDTKTINAYVTGFGSTKRIVLSDTLIEKMIPSEILFVVGHEMGHYVLHHIWWLFLFGSTMTFIILYLTYRTSYFLMARYQKRFGFRHLHQIASFPLFLLLITLFQLLFSPLFNMFSRSLEHQADRFGLEITQNNKAAAEAFVALVQENLIVPRQGTLYTIWRASHPCVGSRIDFCNDYCPWKQNKPLEYEKYFSR